MIIPYITVAVTIGGRGGGNMIIPYMTVAVILGEGVT